MRNVQEIPVPPGSLLGEVLAQSHVFADAYAAELDTPVSLEELIAAFYRSPVFWPERLMINLATRSDASAAALSALVEGSGKRFALWRVTNRRANEIYLRDQTGRTASWLAVDGCWIMFGSAVYPISVENDKTKMGAAFWALLWFHRFYSKALLRSAARRL